MKGAESGSWWDSAQDLEEQVHDPLSLNYIRVFEADGMTPQVVEERDTVAEDDRHQADLDRIQQPGIQTLLGDVRAGNGDDPVAGDLLGRGDCGLHSVGDEGERGMNSRRCAALAALTCDRMPLPGKLNSMSPLSYQSNSGPT
jgi:hypothetical protein